MRKTELHPQIFVIENFLSDQECDHYIEMTQDKVFEEAKINMRGRQVMSKGIRNNDRLMIFDENLAENLYERAIEFLPQIHDNYEVSGFNEMFRIYEGGETEFEHLFTVAPKKGSALVFYHPLRHEGKTLISRQKYVLRTDVMYLKT
jgi:prolyl 4-hydroxylase